MRGPHTCCICNDAGSIAVSPCLSIIMHHIQIRLFNIYSECISSDTVRVHSAQSIVVSNEFWHHETGIMCMHLAKSQLPARGVHAAANYERYTRFSRFNAAAVCACLSLDPKINAPD